MSSCKVLRDSMFSLPLTLPVQVFCLGAGILAAIGMGDLSSRYGCRVITDADKVNFVGSVMSTIVNVAVTLLTGMHFLFHV